MNLHQLEVPLPRAEIRSLRAQVAATLDDLTLIRDQIPEDQLIAIGSALLAARGELSGLLGEDGD